MSDFQTIQSYVWLFVGILGALGSFWIILQYNRLFFLRTVPGFFVMAIAWIDLPQAVAYSLRGLFYLLFGTSAEEAKKNFQGTFRDAMSQLADWSNISATVLCLGFAAMAVSIGYCNGNTVMLKTQRWVWIVVAAIAPFLIYFAPYAIQLESQKTKTDPIWMAGRFADPIKNCTGPFCFLPSPRIYYFFIILVMNIANIVSSSVGWYVIRRTRTSGNKTNASRIIMMRLIVSFAIANVFSWIVWLVDEAAYNFKWWWLSDDVQDPISMTRIFILSFRGFIHALAVYYTLRAMPKALPDDDSYTSEAELSSNVRTFDYTDFGEKTSITIPSSLEPAYTSTEKFVPAPQWSISDRFSWRTDNSPNTHNIS